MSERCCLAARTTASAHARTWTVPDGSPPLVHVSKEDAETVTAFFEDMKMRGLNELLPDAATLAHCSKP
jgi:hypothetical protein